jgi:hypothetical protein
VLHLNGRNVSFVNNAEHLGVTFNWRTTWRLHMEETAAKALAAYVRTYSLFKSERLSIYLHLTLYKALMKIMSVPAQAGSMH